MRFKSPIQIMVVLQLFSCADPAEDSALAIKSFGHSCFGLPHHDNTSEKPADPKDLRLQRTAIKDLSTMDVDGVAKIYDRNSSGNLIDVQLTLTGDGTLTSQDFVTATGDIPRAFAEDHRFVYAPDDPRFQEASLFANGTRMLNWLKSFGFDTRGEQIGIGVHEEIGGSINNAMYIPAFNEGGSPAIHVGDGDGVILQNLPIDADVMTHALGHHLIYRSVKSAFGESLIVHEGLADFFTMIRNDDPCLGATICPQGSEACWQEGQCLRTADNSLKFDDPEPTPSHLRGQVLSGMLWDIKQTGAISNDDLAKLVYHAVGYLSEQTSARELVDSLKASDRQHFEGRYSELIQHHAEARHIF